VFLTRKPLYLGWAYCVPINFVIQATPLPMLFLGVLCEGKTEGYAVNINTANVRLHGCDCRLASNINSNGGPRRLDNSNKLANKTGMNSNPTVMCPSWLPRFRFFPGPCMVHLEPLLLYSCRILYSLANYYFIGPARY
jgi:hypothetical protein